MNNRPGFVRVWDLPVRLFHWVLVALLAASWITAEAGIQYMTWHMRCGYAILALVLFRLLWGFVGSPYARCGSFVAGVPAAWRYVRSWFSARPLRYAGHNPLGGWMVLALLLLIAAQAATGLFATDDIFNDGPLNRLVSNDTADTLTGWHHLIFNLLLVAAALHVLAVALYLLVKRDNLVLPMVTGRKADDGLHHVQAARRVPWWRAGILAAASAAMVWALVEWLPGVAG